MLIQLLRDLGTVVSRLYLPSKNQENVFEDQRTGTISNPVHQWYAHVNSEITHRNPIRVSAFKFPTESEISSNSLCCRSRVESWIQRPISLGKCSKWLCETSSIIKLTSFPIPAGSSLILFSRRLNIVRFWKTKTWHWKNYKGSEIWVFTFTPSRRPIYSHYLCKPTLNIDFSQGLQNRIDPSSDSRQNYEKISFSYLTVRFRISSPTTRIRLNRRKRVVRDASL
jgi:hypothetical protein